MLDEASTDLGSGDKFPGDVAFKLYDTYGFPLDLTEDALKSRDITVDMDAFNAAMERQRADARAAWVGSGEAATEEVWFGIREDAGATDFLGYETEEAEGAVVALVVDGKTVDRVEAGTDAVVILNQTPFYGESGGQVGDTGEMHGVDGVRFTVSETQKKLGDLFVHHGRVETGTIAVGDALELKVDHSPAHRHTRESLCDPSLA